MKLKVEEGVIARSTGETLIFFIWYFVRRGNLLGKDEGRF